MTPLPPMKNLNTLTSPQVPPVMIQRPSPFVITTNKFPHIDAPIIGNTANDPADLQDLALHDQVMDAVHGTRNYHIK